VTANSLHEPVELSRQALILDAAARLFYERGYGSVGMRTIAEAAGVRAASLYHYFASKTDLLYHISLGVTKDFIDELLPLLSGPTPQPAQLVIFICRHIELRWSRRHWISTAQQELRSLEPERCAEIASYLRCYQQAVQDFIALGAGQGVFHVPSVRLAGIALIDMLNGVNAWYRPDGPQTIAQIAQAYAELAVSNLLQATSEERWTVGGSAYDATEDGILSSKQ
jgi:AcrR family transcriptional regulator